MPNSYNIFKPGDLVEVVMLTSTAYGTFQHAGHISLTLTNAYTASNYSRATFVNHAKVIIALAGMIQIQRIKEIPHAITA